MCLDTFAGDEQFEADVESSETEAISEVEAANKIPSHRLRSPCNQLRNPSAPLNEMVSFSSITSTSKLPGFCAHITALGKGVIAADSFAPLVYKSEGGNVRDYIGTEESYTAVGMTSTADNIYIQFMDVSEYLRVIYVYNVKGDMQQKWETPNLLGSSLAIVNGKVVISSRDKLTVCSVDGSHIKDIALQRRCVRRLCAMPSSSEVIISSGSINQVSKVDTLTGQLLWANSTIQAPASVATDRIGRVYVLIKPADICVLNGDSGNTNF